MKINIHQIFNISAFVFFACALAFPSGYSYGAVLLVLAALGGVSFWYRTQPNRWTSYLILTLVVMGFYWSHSFESFAQLTGSDYWIKYGLAAMCLVAVAQIGIGFRWVAYGIAAGGIGALGIAAYQYLVLGMNKATGYTNAIQYGDIAMYLGIASWALALFSRERWKDSVVFAGAGACAVLASLLSETRGAWIVAPFMLLWLLVWMFQFGRAKLAGYAVVAMVVAVAAMVIPYGEKFTSRAHLAVVEVQAYAKNPVQAAETSIGQRLEQWRLAEAMWEDKPWLGWGTQGVTAGKQSYVDQGLAHPSVMSYGHAHNEVMDVLAKRGLLGLVLLLLFYAVPLLAFWPTRQRIARVEPLNREQVLGLRSAGALLPLAMFGFGWTQVFFAHNSGNMFYMFAIVVLWGGICHLERPSKAME